MKDRDFLIWLHTRLIQVHGEEYELDYMWKLRTIVLNTPPDKDTPNNFFAILENNGQD